MFISGFVYANSYQRRNIKTFGDAYLLKNILDKAIRYTLPFAIIFIIEIIYMLMRRGLSADIKIIIKAFLCGGFGPGSFYYPVMMQLIFFFPVIFFIIKQHKFKGLILCFSMNFVYELLSRAYELNSVCYRLLLFRYIFVIACGCYALLCVQRVSMKIYISSFIAGTVYIIIYSYSGLNPVIIKYWTGTSLFACLYFVPVIILTLKLLSLVRFRILELTGMASYHIFLVQMIYFFLGAGFIYRNIDSKLLELSCDIIICWSFGIIFYFMTKPLTVLVKKKIYCFVHLHKRQTISRSIQELL